MKLEDVDITELESESGYKSVVSSVSSESGKKKKEKVSPIIVALLVIIMLTVLLVIGLYITKDYQAKKDREMLQIKAEEEKVMYDEETVDNMILEAVNEAKAETEARVRDQMIADIRKASEETSGIAFMLREFFPDYVIFSETAKYSYYPIDKSLAPLSVENEKITTDEKTGFRYYTNADGSSASFVGIDVSSFQKDIDWSRVKAAGVDYAMIRCAFRGYGTGAIVSDPSFETNVQEALKNDIPVGVYFFSAAISEEEAVEEADYLLECIAPYRITWPIVLDVEAISDSSRMDGLTVEERTNLVVAFCNRIKEAGYVPMVYTNLKFFIKNLDLSKLEGIEKWYAYYNDSIYFPYEIAMWQYSDAGVVDGINGVVDLNISFKNFGEDVSAGTLVPVDDEYDEADVESTETEPLQENE